MPGPKVGSRDLSRVLSSLSHRRHYVALKNMVVDCPDWQEALYRYISGRGEYPWSPRIRTPIGVLTPTLYSHHDLLTFNEIFCRHDYSYAHPLGVVIDIGSNIGISGLYFLSRNPYTYCHLFEPVPMNVRRLQKNLQGFAGRFTLEEAAVTTSDGNVDFAIEPTGRYGGIRPHAGHTMTVRAVAINAILEQAIQRHGKVDLVKIDTEGTESELISAIDDRLLSAVASVVAEATPDRIALRDRFHVRQDGKICRLYPRGR